ncbi:OmpA family protein [Reichenbachiella carrageenanivorans]|uniref:OmpA family protein n=1 Tax=Reichenbachiella carrageenanivorans TaxID=2979869 RepID=A0ABY6D1P0_9BACT|nr:OmpA family protein [Reichenbachiella carrageenanivorans]UXX80061.1 OmpA family protein [Reichenbachiella carrageenanivorans]
MQRKIYTLILVVQFSLPLCGQTITSSVLRKADKEFNEFSYANAVTYYKLVLKKDASQKYAISQVALSYRNLNQPDSAEVWFKKAIESDTTHTDFYFYLAEALLSNQKYTEAKYWYGQYHVEAKSDSRSSRKLAALEDIDQFFINKDQVIIEPIVGNSKGSDFSPAFFKDGIMFVSSRPRSMWVKHEFNWDESNFLDYYYFSNSDEAIGYYEGGLNTKFHEGPLVFYNHQQSVVYTRNNLDRKKLKKGKNGVTNLKLFFANWDSNLQQWVNETPFVYNDDNYSIGAPAISEDGSVLIFSSDMPGGFGASDLYVSYRDSQGWSKPQNLGASVNSEGRDGFPFIYQDQLYFASDGLEGLGGLDIYRIDFDAGAIGQQVSNLGAPFNSSRDDFGLIVNESDGYFSSNRGESHVDNIYKFRAPSIEHSLIMGEVCHLSTNMPIQGADVFVKGKTGEYLYTRSDKNGHFSILTPRHTDWVVTARKFNYNLMAEQLADNTNEDTLEIRRLYLREISTETVVVSNDSTVPVVAVPVEDNRIKSYDETSFFVDEFSIGDTLRADSVYFDRDSYELRTDAMETLGGVVNFMIEHVEIGIELHSHTDSRDSYQYNQVLSENRSVTARDYLVERGIDIRRITLVNHGESKLVNDCGNGVPCTEYQYERNRRVVIYLIKEGTSQSF